MSNTAGAPFIKTLVTTRELRLEALSPHEQGSGSCALHEGFFPPENAYGLQLSESDSRTG